ncbi:MAG: putative Ig domain-containing protein [Verrucomicrobia bacterium]|nr:putative Ig domain-containing protein [Verrucomicrobiota bacterium]
MKISNHGLVTAKSLRLYFEPNSVWSFTPLQSQCGDLAGLSSLTVPLSITRLPGKAKGASECGMAAMGVWDLFCGSMMNSYRVPIAVVNFNSDCGGGGGGGWGGGGGGGGGRPAITGPSFASGTNKLCDPCVQSKVGVILNCLYNFIPLPGFPGCLKGYYDCLSSVSGDPPATNDVSTALNLMGCGATMAGCLGIEVSKKVSMAWIGLIITGVTCMHDYYLVYSSELCQGKSARAGGGSGGSPQVGSFSYGNRAKAGGDEFARVQLQLDRLTALLGPVTNLFGDPAWFASSDQILMPSWLAAFELAAQTNSDARYLISTAERAQLLAPPLPSSLTSNDVVRFLDRWNRTCDYYSQGIFNSSQVPTGWNTNFIARDVTSSLAFGAHDALSALEAEGYTDPVQAVQQATGDLVNRLSVGGGGGTCARVRLQIDQDAVITRDAFKATLEIVNSTSSQLTEVTIQLLVHDRAGGDTTSLFGIGTPQMSGLTGVDGAGVINTQSVGKAVWTLVPSAEAAPLQATEHLVSGTLQYRQDGALVTVPLAPSSISVLPSPSLTLRYFHQRDVFADDPFTPQIEPSLPYSLAVMVQNHGHGVAHNLQIASAQPRIVDNEKGLVIDFRIIGAQIGAQPVTPSLTVNFGDLLPGQTRIGRWLLTSSLQGLFTDYNATFEQVTELGDERLSLFDGLEIHELTRVVQAPGAWNDSLPDFLVNEVADVNSLPDTLYLSDGRIQPVSVVQTAVTDGAASASHLQVQCSAALPTGFAYVRVPDPGNGQFTLANVIRADGSQLRTDNFWTTDRTFVGLGQRPIRENMLHLFDYHTNAGPDTYTLVYAASSTLSQTNPPVRAVLALPPLSSLTFPVAWSGQNAAGQASVATYDIYVSDNGGAFAIWQSRTTGTSALYSGSFGHTYAFYSVATDTAGNVELPHATPDATTLVNLINAPPTISFGAAVTVNEGETVRINPTVSDPDLPSQTLTFRLLGGAPPGVVVNSASGQLQWVTGPGSGPTTNVLGVVVTDNGFPPLSGTGYVTVIVRQVIWPPVLAPVSNYTIKEGALLVITNVVMDYNVPERAYLFSLGPNPPSGASINPTNGLFTWMPGSTQGPSTNFLTFIVTDANLSALSATQTFTVVVRDVLSDLVLGVGHTNLMAGESGVVPVTLACTLDLTHLTFQLDAEMARLTNLTLRPAAIEVTSVALQPLGSNTYAASFTLNPALQLNATRTLAQLEFLAVSQPHSAIVPLKVSSPRGLQSSGLALTNTTGLNGRVIVVAAEPVLEIAPGRILTLYGHPGTDCALEYRTNLVSSTPWTEFARLSLGSRSVQLTNLPAPGPTTFYRAYEARSSGLDLQNIGGSVFRLTLRGQPDTHYSIQSATNLAVPLYWADVFTVTLTNSVEWFNWTNLGEPKRFFRVISY